jgi:multiple sugar transport system permease protein
VGLDQFLLLLFGDPGLVFLSQDRLGDDAIGPNARAVIFPQVAAVIAVFVFKQFFDGLPRDFEEAARIDGAGFWTIYRSVVLPLSRPVIGAISIITFVDVWNNLILPLFVLSNPKLMTIPVGLATVQGSFGQRLSDIQASAILGALPLVILFLIFQRRIVEGVAGSGLKG